MREIRTLRATWRELETWCGSGPRATPARQPSTLPMSGDGKRSVAEWPKLPRPSSTLPSASAEFGRGSKLPIYFSMSAFPRGVRPEAGQRVTFEIADSPRNGKPMACGVELADGLALSRTMVRARGWALPFMMEYRSDIGSFHIFWRQPR